MKKKTNTHAPESVNPLPVDITQLTPQAAALRIVEQSTVAERAFIIVAMLLLHLETTLKAGQTLGGLVIKLASVPDKARRRLKSTIDNARYAMRVWKELVVPGHVTADVFQTFTFGDCLTINKCLTPVSRQKFTGSDVALVIQASPKDWHDELESLFTYGQSVEDRAKTVAANEAKKGTEDKDAAKTAAGASPDDAGESGGSETPAGDADEGATTPPSNIVPMPSQVHATVEDAFKVIATLEALFAVLEPADVAKAAVALNELNTTVQASLTAKPKKAAAKRKAVKAKVTTQKQAKKAA